MWNGGQKEPETSGEESGPPSTTRPHTRPKTAPQANNSNRTPHPPDAEEEKRGYTGEAESEELEPVEEEAVSDRRGEGHDSLSDESRHICPCGEPQKESVAGEEDKASADTSSPLLLSPTSLGQAGRADSVMI